MMISTTPSLEVATLGRFEVRRNSYPLSGGNWSRRKVVDLFKLLLSAERHRFHREQIQEILWPTSSSEQAANSFGKTLYLLRRALEPDLAAGKGSASIYVLLDHDTLMLNLESMRIDADIFESSAKALQAKMRNRSAKEQSGQEDADLLEEFDQVVALYKGDYLPEDLYEDWSQRKRDRLRRLHSWLLENAAELALVNRKGMHAVEYYQALLERNSADEQTHRQLMLTYARMGRRNEAYGQYLLLRKALREELRANPLPETNELFRRIQMGQIAVDLTETIRGSGPLLPVTSSLQDTSAPSHVSGHEPEESGTVKTRSVSTAIASLPEQDAPSQLDPDRILKAELVGREEEIARMQRAFNLAGKGQRRVIFICGEPGIGKTRLSQEFTHWDEVAQQATVLWGYCYEMSGLLPYQPIIDAIGAHIRTCSPEKLRQLLGNTAVDLAKIAPEVRLKLPDLPQPEPLGPEIERRNLYSAVAHYFNALAAERPLMLILDDLQWADAATMQLLNFLTLQNTGSNPFDDRELANRSNARPLYLMLYRTGEVHETHPLRELIATLVRGNIGEELRLQRLNEEQVQKLLVNMARHYVQPAFASEIYRQTEGNPFYIGEAIRSLIFEGKLKWTGEYWQATVKPDELDIPQSVRLVIERRLVHLSPECRATLALAAVLGRQFSSALLCQASNFSEEVVAEHIDFAIQAQILTSLYESGRNKLTSLDYGQDVDLAFTHDKIREVLYQWLNPLRRRALHRRVSQAIESCYAEHLTPYYSTLAYHHQMAEELAQAADYLLKATYQAMSVYAFTDAAAYLRTALDLLIGDKERPRRAALLHQLANLYLYTGQLDEAMKTGLASCTLWSDLGDVVKQAETYLDVSFLCHWQGREADAVKYIQCALECLEKKPGEIYLLAKAYTNWGLAATVMGDIPAALDKLHQAEILHTQVGGNDPFISVVLLWSRSWCAFLADSPKKMLEYALQGVEVCCTVNKPDWEPMMNYSVAWAYMLLGQLIEGEQAARTALEKAQQHGVVGAQGWSCLVSAFIAIQAGQWDEAKHAGDNAYTIASMLHDADLQSRILWSRSVCSGWQGNWERAISDILEAIQIAVNESETLLVYPYLLVQAAKAYFFAGKPTQAQYYLDQGMELAQNRQYRQLPAIGRRLQGRIYQAQGRYEEAQPCFERSLAELLALDDVVEYARTQEAYGLFFLARSSEGDLERGQKLVKSAQETFERLGVNG
jgi:DNA-binding SARP family transcriptional activator/tetratricopeptide (TPR) repeat protein